MGTICSCDCHANPYLPCSVTGGCGGQHTEPEGCVTCHDPDHAGGRPICPRCLERAEAEIRGLLYDYLDLAQLHEASMSQAINEPTSGGSPESPMLLVGHVEALQAEIVHVTGTWEHALRAVHQLHNPRTFAPLWRTTVYDHLNLTGRGHVLRKARSGALVQRAVGVIAPRLERLADLPAVTVCPTGIEDEPTRMHGWEAVQHLQNLHARSRSTLGRTTRKFWIPGTCWACATRTVTGVDGPLFRSEPLRHEDPMQIHCAPCEATRPYADYERYMLELAWPETVPA